VLTHELGHALGLDHTDQARAKGAENYYPWTNLPGKPASPFDVMNSTYWPDGINRTLTDDEMGGLAFIYGLKRGDATLDGSVDVLDLSAVSAHWNSTSDWTGGDFDDDGIVGLADLTIVAANWDSWGGLIPEPASLALFWLAAGMLIGRRRG